MRWPNRSKLAAAPPDLRAMPVFYINLDHRQDRRDRTEQLWRDQFQMQAVTRVRGVLDEPAFRGCTLAHLAAVNRLLETARDAPYVVLAEDDLILLPEKSPSVVIAGVGNALARFQDLNLLFLTATLKRFKTTDLPGVVKLKRRGAKAMAGMVIRREYLPRLKRIYVKALTRNLPHDKLTQYVQGRHHWYLLWPHLMHQGEGYSDIEKRHVNYEYLGDNRELTRLGVAARN